MRASLSDSTFTVQCLRSDVAAFAARWPCFGPSNHPITFFFHSESGDLIDLLGDHIHNDQSGLAALADDAKRYGAQRLKLEHLL